MNAEAPCMPPTAKKHKIICNVLTLEGKIAVINRLEKGESSNKIAQSLGVGRSQIWRIVTNKEDIRKKWESGEQAGQKYCKAKRSVYNDLNSEVFEWLCDVRSKNYPVSG